MMSWWLALVGVAMTFMALPMPLRAAGTPECPQTFECVAGNPFTELGDANCDRVLELADLTLLVRAPFCDACRTCTAPGQFNAPQFIAVFGDRVYVTDSGNNRVQAFNRTGGFLTQWGETGDAPQQFMSPRGIAVDRDGYVYVVDSGNDRTQKFTPNGGFIVSFGHTSPGRFINAIGVAVAGNGDVFVVNSTEKRIVVWQTPQ